MKERSERKNIYIYIYIYIERNKAEAEREGREFKRGEKKKRED